jgi:hypothetical protein
VQHKLDTFERTVSSSLDHVASMGAGIAIDLRKSFAMSAKGPSSMLGKKAKRGTVVTDEYHAAEEDREEERKAAAKRGHKPSTTKAKPKSRAKRSRGGGGNKRPDKRARDRARDEEVSLSNLCVLCSWVSGYSCLARYPTVSCLG